MIHHFKSHDEWEKLQKYNGIANAKWGDKILKKLCYAVFI